MKASTKQQPKEETERAKTTTLRDRTFETLSNPRRRQALRYLRAHKADSPVVIRDLAERIAAWENDIPTVEVTYKQRKRVYTSLYQSHLPKLHSYGFIDYDSDRGTIELTPQAEQLDIYLEVVPNGSLSWSDVYLGTSVVAAALVTAFYFGAIPFVHSWQLLGFFVILFSGISLVHSVTTRQNTLYE
ncbi:MAG: hypothetical protein V5A36_00560 [Natronomonas sp.]